MDEEVREAGLPFACGPNSPADSRAGADPVAALNAKRVTQCALSRVCGGCGRALGRPIAFAGPPSEVGRNAFHFPALHPACARQLVERLPPELPAWQIVTTAGFEFVRAAKEDSDRRPTFQPNSLLG